MLWHVSGVYISQRMVLVVLLLMLRKVAHGLSEHGNMGDTYRKQPAAACVMDVPTMMFCLT